MNLSACGGVGQSSAVATPPSPTHPYLTTKRCNNTQPLLSTSSTDLRELTTTLQELNNQFKKNVKVLTEIKDHIAKACEKQDARPVDENSGIHKLEKVCIY
jgi:hypothetical protein